MTNEQMRMVIDAIQGIDNRVRKGGLIGNRLEEMRAPVTVDTSVTVDGYTYFRFADGDGGYLESRTVCHVMNELCKVLAMIDEFKKEELNND